MLTEIYVTFAATVVAIVTVTQFLKGIFNTSGFASQLLSWGTGLVIVMFGFYSGLGWLAEVELWWHAAIWGFGASLAANGIFEVPIIKTIITTIFAFLKK